MTRLSTLLSTLGAMTLTSLGSAAQAESFSPDQSTATLLVTYKLAGAGVDRPESHTKNVTWTVDDRYDVKATMKARKPSGFASLHKPDATAAAREQERAAQMQAAQANAAPMMAMAQQAMAKCGDDEACLAREVQKMSQNIDPNSPQLKAARASGEAAAKVAADRYQLFESGLQSGTFKVAEKSHEAYYDAACSPKTEASCSTDTVATGEGPQTDGKGGASLMTAAMAEYDANAGTLMLKLPSVGVAMARRDVTSTANKSKSGSKTEQRSLPVAATETMQHIKCGECRKVSGKLTMPAADQLLGRPATITIEWNFERT